MPLLPCAGWPSRSAQARAAAQSTLAKNRVTQERGPMPEERNLRTNEPRRAAGVGRPEGRREHYLGAPKSCHREVVQLAGCGAQVLAVLFWPRAARKVLAALPPDELTRAIVAWQLAQTPCRPCSRRRQRAAPQPRPLLALCDAQNWRTARASRKVRPRPRKPLARSSLLGSKSLKESAQGGRPHRDSPAEHQPSRAHCELVDATDCGEIAGAAIADEFLMELVVRQSAGRT